MKFIFPILLIFVSLAILSWIFFHRLPQLTLLDLDTLPKRKEEKKKREILKKRITLKSAHKKINWRARFVPIAAEWHSIQSAFRTYVGKLQREVMLEKQRKTEEVPLGDQARRDQEVVHAINQARHAAEQREWEEAERQYIAAIRMDIKNTEAYRGLGDVYFSEGQMKEAKETYLFLLQLLPDDDGIMMKLGETAEIEGNLEEAVRYYEQAVVLNDHIPARFAKIADILDALKQPEGAFEAIRQAVELEPENPKYLDKLIEMSILIGDPLLAEEALRQLRIVNPENQKIEAFQDKIRKMPS